MTIFLKENSKFKYQILIIFLLEFEVECFGRIDMFSREMLYPLLLVIQKEHHPVLYEMRDLGRNIECLLK